MDSITNKFHSFLVNLAFDDENCPKEALEVFLRNFSLERRIQCLRYFMEEYNEGQLDTFWKYRYENDSFLWLIGTPPEDMDGQAIIDMTMGRLKELLSVYVPNKLTLLEERMSGPLAENVASVPHVESVSAHGFIERVPLPPEGLVVLNSTDAADFLGKASMSKMYKLDWLNRKVDGSNLYWKHELVAYLMGKLKAPDGWVASKRKPKPKEEKPKPKEDKLIDDKILEVKPFSRKKTGGGEAK